MLQSNMNERNYCRLCPGITTTKRYTTKGSMLYIILLCILANSSIIERISCYARLYASNEPTLEILSNSINLNARKGYNSHLANNRMQTPQMFNSDSNDHDDDDKSNHPIIVYKYDIIDEYNDPADVLQVDEDFRNSRDTESYTLLKPKKIYFDFISNKPSLHSAGVLSPNPKGEKPTIIDPYHDGKSEVGQRIKKNSKHNENDGYNDRKKRDTAVFELRNLQKRTPRVDYLPSTCTNCATDRSKELINYLKHAVPGKKHNALDIPVPPVVPRTAIMPDMNVSIDSRIAADENDRVIFPPGRRPTNRPKSNRRPTEVIYRDPQPQGFDAAFMSENSIGFQANRFVPSYSGAAKGTESAAFGPTGAFLPTNSRPTAAAPSERKVSITQCVWAIVNCCSSSSNEIRYSCFERNGCFGAFWDLNPCAVEVLDNVVTFVGDYYE